MADEPAIVDLFKKYREFCKNNPDKCFISKNCREYPDQEKCTQR